MTEPLEPREGLFFRESIGRLEEIYLLVLLGIIDDRDQQGKTWQEIFALLLISPDQVKLLIARAREQRQSQRES